MSTAVILFALMCVGTMTVHTNGKCDDGSEPVRIELHILEAPGVVKKFSEFDGTEVKTLIAIWRDGKKVFNLPLDNYLSAGEIKAFLDVVAHD